MAEAIKKKRINITFGGLMVIVLGILLVVNAEVILKSAAWIIGLIISIVGLSQFIGNIFSESNKSSGMLVGGLICVLGLWIMFRPDFIISFFPMLIGVVMVVHGIQNMAVAFAGRAAEMKKWWLLLIGSIINIFGGIFCIVYSFSVGVIALQVVGIMLIYDGVVSIFSVNRVNHYEKQKVIDAEYWEIKDEQ